MLLEVLEKRSPAVSIYGLFIIASLFLNFIANFDQKDSYRPVNSLLMSVSGESESTNKRHCW